MKSERVYLEATILVGLVVLVTGLLSLHINSIMPCQVTSSSLSDFQKQSVSIYLEMTKFFTSISLTVAGLSGGMVLLSAQGKMTLTPWPLRFSFLSFGFAGGSLYFGYVSYSGVFEGLINNCADFTGTRFRISQMIQFYSMIAALGLGIGVVLSQAGKVLESRMRE